VSVEVAGLEETKNPAGQKGLRLIQIRLATPSLAKTTATCQINSPQAPNRRFKFQKRRQLFIRTNNETFSVTAIRVSNPDVRPLESMADTPTPTPSGFAEIVRDDFPVLHPQGCVY
jgi:hypothetical protein